MFTLNRELSLGNILTSVSILIGLGTFLYNEVEKRGQIDRAFAAEIQDQIGRAQIEAERLDSALKLFFLSVEPVYVSTSQLGLDFDLGGETARYQAARDFLWQFISEERARMEARVLSETSVGGGLASVGTAQQTAYSDFRKGHDELRVEAYSALASGTQLALKSAIETAEFTAQIGGALRQVHQAAETEYIARSAALIEQFNRELGKAP